LEYQPLTDGVCDDVLDVVEGIASETVIELMQEENNGPKGRHNYLPQQQCASRS
jgi:hypothetical protein